ncbi:MAG: hypothetical protein B7X93_08835 [Hydrogenophilales bacterium 17-61-9]|nr:MAG: hypothetical protein B7X93_08835 [Hydrogenophilales bacterium 17-61-9]
MTKKLNLHQATYLAVVAQTLAVGYFSWAGLPALELVVKGKMLPQSMYDLVLAFLVYSVFTVAGYAVLDERLTGKDEDE